MALFRKIGNSLTWTALAFIPLILLAVFGIPVSRTNAILTWMLWMLAYFLAVQGDPVGTPIRLAFLKPGVGWGVLFGMIGGFITGIGTWTPLGAVAGFVSSIFVKYTWLWIYYHALPEARPEARGEEVG